MPPGVTVPAQYCPTCGGLDFADEEGDNEALVTNLLAEAVPGYYVFSAPWETVSALLGSVAGDHGLLAPKSYGGPDQVYALSLGPLVWSNLATYDAHLAPSSSYPTLPAPIVGRTCTPPTPSAITVQDGVNGAVVPAFPDNNEVLYIVRHAEAHPQATGLTTTTSVRASGQRWTCRTPSPARRRRDEVWSGDPATFPWGRLALRASTTGHGRARADRGADAIANGLPSSWRRAWTSRPRAWPGRRATSSSARQFPGHKILLGFTYTLAPQMLTALVASYFPNGGAPTIPAWSPADYDSLWIVTLDASGNLTLDFTNCEGIDSASLPATAPQIPSGRRCYVPLLGNVLGRVEAGPCQGAHIRASGCVPRLVLPFGSHGRHPSTGPVVGSAQTRRALSARSDWFQQEEHHAKQITQGCDCWNPRRDDRRHRGLRRQQPDPYSGGDGG